MSALQTILEHASGVIAGGNLNRFLGIIDVSHTTYYGWLKTGSVSPKSALLIEALCAKHNLGGEPVRALDLCPRIGAAAEKLEPFTKL